MKTRHAIEAGNSAEAIAWLPPVIWESPSANSSESMPCGGGDIGMNVWVEQGDLLFYFCRSGNFDENGTLLKHGRMRLRLDPNPFGESFRQELQLHQGTIRIEAGSGNQRVGIEIWVDVFRPVIHVEVEGATAFDGEVGFESWRFEDRTVEGVERAQCNSYHAYCGKVVTSRDEVEPCEEGLVFYHRNREGALLVDFLMRQQDLGAGDALWNPQKNLTFGGLLRGDGLRHAGTDFGSYAGTPFQRWSLRTKQSTRRMVFQLVLHSGQAACIEQWKEDLKEAVQAAAPVGARAETLSWWRTFWERSRIVIQPDHQDPASPPWQVGRNYQLARFLLGCNARGELGQKFNGGLFTADPVHIKPEWKNFTPDFRLWGGSVYTAQNQRLLFWPTLKSGDFELPIQEFERYRRALPAAELRSRIYWGHEGASFTEQVELCGLPAAAMYGFATSENPARVRPVDLPAGALTSPWVRFYYATQLEFAWMILEWGRFTGRDVGNYLPFIESCLRFYEAHFGQDPGRLRISPSQSIEMYFNAVDPLPDIAGLKAVLQGLLALPLKTERRSAWEALLARIPNLPRETLAAKEVLAPAHLYDLQQQNSEIPELYAIFPYSFFGLGLPELQLARDTWEHGRSNNLRSFTECWSQVPIFAARLGLLAEATSLIQEKLGDAPRRFPAFWGPGPDYVPDIDHGGSGMIALQEMLLQTPGKRLLVLPCWPKEWDVDFVLHAPYETIVSVVFRAGRIRKLRIEPASRALDLDTAFPIDDPPAASKTC